MLCLPPVTSAALPSQAGEGKARVAWLLCQVTPLLVKRQQQGNCQATHTTNAEGGSSRADCQATARLSACQAIHVTSVERQQQDILSGYTCDVSGRRGQTRTGLEARKGSSMGASFSLFCRPERCVQ